MDILKQYKQNGIYVKHAVTNMPSNDAFPMHIHDNFEVYFFVSGEVEYLVEGAGYHLRPGDLLLIRPAEAHKPKILSKIKYERYNINFPRTLLHSIDPENRLLKSFLNRPLGEKNLYSAAELGELPIKNCFYDICYSEDDAYGKQLKILTFLIKLLDDVNIAYERKNTSERMQNIREGEIVKYVNFHITENISVPQLANKFYLSVSQFNRIFKNATGAAPWTYITAKRLAAAKEKLLCGISAHDAAVACGFNDYSVFYRAYTKHFGHAPTKEDIV